MQSSLLYTMNKKVDTHHRTKQQSKWRVDICCTSLHENLHM